MQPGLVIIGISQRTAPLEIRERFWLDAQRRAEALTTLSAAEAIDEIFVFSTCQRTEFVVWGDPTLAINSVIRFLSAKYDLKLSEWNCFYRLLDQDALVHAFRVASGLDSTTIAERQIARQANAAWQQARTSGSVGPYLNAVLRKALAIRRRIGRETDLRRRVSAAQAAVKILREKFASLANLNVVVLGAGAMGEMSAQVLRDHGISSICLVSPHDSHTAELAGKLKIQSELFQHRHGKLAAADVVISAVCAPERLLTTSEIGQIASERENRELMLIDLAVPRCVEATVRWIPGVILYDLDDLERAICRSANVSEDDVGTQRLILEQVQSFRKEVAEVDASPSIFALRHRLDEICRQELDSFRQERGPFPKDQDRLLAAVSARITHRIAGSLARELKDVQSSRMNAAV